MERYHLTIPQEKIWRVQQFYENTAMMNIGGVMLCQGVLDWELIERTIVTFVERNDSIRVRLGRNGAGVEQYIEPFHGYVPGRMDLSALTEEAAAQALMKAMGQPFSLYDADLFEFQSVRYGKEESGFFLRLNHVVGDAYTIGLICAQMAGILRHFTENVPLPPPGPCFLESVKREDRYRETVRFVEDQQYWEAQRAMMGDGLTTLGKPSRNPAGGRLTYHMEAKEAGELREVCQVHGVSFHQFLQSIWAVYLARVNSASVVTIGAPWLNREREERQVMGLFVNSLPLTLTAEEDMTFEALCAQARKRLYGNYKHGRYPVEETFDVVVSYQNATIGEEGQGFRTVWVPNGYSEVNLTFHADDRDRTGGLTFHLDYRKEAFLAGEPALILRRLLFLMEQAAKQFVQRLDQFEVMTPEEKALLIRWNETSVPLQAQTVLELIQQQARKRPEQTVYLDQTGAMEYVTLWHKAGFYAELLDAQGGRNGVIAVRGPRSAERLALLLGIWRVGGAFLPIGEETPEKRLIYQLQDSGAVLLVELTEPVGASETGDFRENCRRRLKITDCQGEKQRLAEGLAYVLYTSGSTGMPKGVMISHRSLAERLAWMNRTFPLRKEDVVLHKTVFTFDVSIWEMFWGPAYGAATVVLPDGAERDPEAIVSAVQRYRVTRMHFVPTMLDAFLIYVRAVPGIGSRVAHVAQVYTSGEALLPQTIAAFYRCFSGTLWNLYGPTECTIDVTWFLCENRSYEEVPIGRPVSNTTAYVVDHRGRLCPVGVPGELWIGGALVGEGYTTVNERTTGAFLKNPFGPGRIYRTGDFVRWNPEGNLLYEGRRDKQVKLNGRRVSLIEIEGAMAQRPEVTSVSVQVYHGRLFGYYVAPKALSSEEWRSFLAERLLPWMIPAIYVCLRELPRLSNGKLDPSSFPAPTESKWDDTAPQNREEQLLAKIVAALLGVESLGVCADLFSLGLTSVMVVRACGQLAQHGILRTAEDFYRNGTVRAILGRDHSVDLLNALSPMDVHSQDASLICVPYGGGNFGMFAPLARMLRCEVLAVSTAQVPEGTDCVALGEQIAEAVGARSRVRLLGACVGAGPALAAAYALEARGIQVEEVILCGILPPPAVRLWGRWISPWSFYSNRRLSRFLERLGGLEEPVTPYLLGRFREDTQRFFHYLAAAKPKPLRAPVTVILGSYDRLAPYGKRAQAGWEKFLGKRVRYRRLETSTHFFIGAEAAQLAMLLEVQKEMEGI